MNDFKIGDKFKLKKLSEEEFKEIYHIKYNWNRIYNEYLSYLKDDFNQVFEVEDLDSEGVVFSHCTLYCYKEEIEKVNYLKTKFKIVNKLLNNNI